MKGTKLYIDVLIPTTRPQPKDKKRASYPSSGPSTSQDPDETPSHRSLPQRICQMSGNVRKGTCLYVYVGCSSSVAASAPISPHPPSSAPQPVDRPFALSLKTLANYLRTRSYTVPLTEPPLIAVRTFLLKPSRLLLKSSAASLLRGSEALGSKNKNYQIVEVSFIIPLTSSVNLPYTPPNPQSPQKLHEQSKNRGTSCWESLLFHTCNPTMTAFKFNTGFQSSRRMFKHTFPSRSMFGW